jgi:hypothetical protein
MSKTAKIIPADFEKTIMAKIRSNEIFMKPRWYFLLGSFSMITGLVGLSIGVAFLTNLTLFLFRQHGPGGQWRLELILNSFSWWIPAVAIIGISLGIWLLKRFDFSYKKNFPLIVIGFIFSIFIAALAMDVFGFNDIWSKRGPMRRFYQQLENRDSIPQRGRGRLN